MVRFSWTRFLPALVLMAAGAAAQDQQARGLALIQRAAGLGDLRSPAAAPLMVRANVKLLGIYGWPDGVAQGEYQLISAPGQSWREHLKFPGWLEVNGLSNGKSWRQRNTANKPMRMFQALRTLDLGYHLKTPPGTRIEKLWQATIGEKPSDCVDVARDDERYSLCFDAASGVLLRARYHKPEAWYEFEGSVAAGGKIYPKVARCTEAAEPAVEVEVLELTEVAAPAAGELAPPEGVPAWPACDNPTKPRLIEKRDVKQAVHAKATRQFGTVVCIGEVGTDGSLHDLAVVQSRGGFNDRAVTKALASWRYEPASCDGVPVPYEITVSYTFMP